METALLPDVQVREACTDVCLACYRSCTETRAWIDARQDREDFSRYCTMLASCADACRATATILMRESAHERLACEACAEIAKGCALRCSAIGMEELAACGIACERAADACIDFASHL